MPGILVQNLSYRYSPAESLVLNQVSFSVDAGKTLGIAGLNGSGKTTLCYCLGGIIPHYWRGQMEGEVFVNGKNTRAVSLPELAGEVGIVLQNPNDQLIMPTVEDEIAFGLENNRVPRAVMTRRIEETLEMTGLTELKNEPPHRLSGGEKQLAVLAAVLALGPRVLICDEALSMLDEEAARRILSVLARLKALKKTLVIVDHTLRAVHLFDEVLVLEKGRVIYRGENRGPVFCRELMLQKSRA